MKKLFLLILTALSLCCQTLYGETDKSAESAQTKNDILFFLDPSWFNSWALGINPGGLLFYKTGYASRVQSQLVVSEDNIRRTMEPGQTLGLNIFTESIQSIGDFVVKGKFGYQNNRYEKIQYNSIMDFRHQNIYSLGDTIIGRQKQEGYFFTADVAYPLFNRRVFAGMCAEFESAIGAKIKDPRNLNTISRFKLHPGVIINQNNFSLGFSGGVILEKNLTTIRVELDDLHSLYNFMGMGHYSAILNISGIQSVRYESEGFQTEIQASLNKGRWSTFHKANHIKLQTIAFTGINHRLKDGITDFSQINYVGQWILKTATRQHNFLIDASATAISGTEIKQVQEHTHYNGHYVPIVRTLRQIKEKHLVDDYAANITYKVSGLSPGRPFRYQFSALAGACYHKTSHFPTEVYGYYQSTSFLVNSRYQHFLNWQGLNIDPFIGADARFVVSSEAFIPAFPNQFVQIPEQNFRYFSENYFTGQAGLALSTNRLPFDRVSQVFLHLSSSYTYFPNLTEQDHFNYSLILSTGVVF